MNDEAGKLFSAVPETAALYAAVERAVLSLGEDVEIRTGKSQVSFRTKKAFAWVWLPPRCAAGRPDRCVVLSFGLDHRIDHPRIVESVEPYPDRWMHHVILERAEDLDAQAMSWLGEAYRFSASGRSHKKRPAPVA